MIEVIRVTGNHANLYSYRATQNEIRATQLESLIESTKPKNIYAEWHELIATPFRYGPPFDHDARFRPKFAKYNIFYSALKEETAFYEYSFHFMRERQHLKYQSETGQRTLFSVHANNDNVTRIHEYGNSREIMSKNDYQISHQFINENPDIKFILYPSCRDPKQGDNAAIFDISLLAKNLRRETRINFFYDNKLKELTWIGHSMHVRWEEVK